MGFGHSTCSAEAGCRGSLICFVSHPYFGEMYCVYQTGETYRVTMATRESL
jgi:hypothetical protein